MVSMYVFGNQEDSGATFAGAGLARGRAAAASDVNRGRKFVIKVRDAGSEPGCADRRDGSHIG